MNTLMLALGLLGPAALLLVMALPLGALIALQVFLCRRSLKLGLILPALSLLVSVWFVLGVALFSHGTGYMSGGSVTMEEDGTVLEERVYEDGMVTVYDGEGTIVSQYPDPDYDREQTAQARGEVALMAAVMFLAFNIPTLAFMGVWLYSKSRRGAREDLRRMRIEDLGYQKQGAGPPA